VLLSPFFQLRTRKGNLRRLLDSNIAISYTEGLDPPIRWKNQNVKIKDSNVKTVKGLGSTFEAKKRTRTRNCCTSVPPPYNNCSSLVEIKFTLEGQTRSE